MINLKIIGYLFLFTLVNVSCSVFYTDESLTGFNLSGPMQGEFTKRFSNKNKTIVIKAQLKGPLRVDEVESQIIDFPNNSTLSIKMVRVGQPDKQLIIEKRKQVLSYKLYKNGHLNNFDSREKKWFSQVLPELYRVTGFDWQRRIDRFKSLGGNDKVFEEIERIELESIKAFYLKNFVLMAKLPEQSLNKALTIVENIKSDTTKREVLLAIVESQEISTLSWRKLIQVSSKISSDSDMKQLFNKIVVNQPLEDSIYIALFVSSKQIESDSEKKKFLLTAVNQRQYNSKVLDSLIETTNDIGSDSDNKRILEQVFLTQHMDDNNWKIFLSASSNISSDNDMANLYQSIISEGKLNMRQLSELIKNIKLIESDAESSELISLIASSQKMDTETWLHLIEASKNIESDSEMATLFQHFLELDLSDAVRKKLYSVTNEFISSESDKNRVLRSILEND